MTSSIKTAIVLRLLLLLLLPDIHLVDVQDVGSLLPRRSIITLLALIPRLHDDFLRIYLVQDVIIYRLLKLLSPLIHFECLAFHFCFYIKTIDCETILEGLVIH